MRRDVEGESKPDPILGDLVIDDLHPLVDDLDPRDAAKGPIRAGDDLGRGRLEAVGARPDDLADLADPHPVGLRLGTPRFGAFEGESSSPTRNPSRERSTDGGHRPRLAYFVRRFYPRLSTIEVPVTVSPGAPDKAPPPTTMADRLAFTSWLPAGVAAALTTAVGVVVGADDTLRLAVLTASGTFVVYALDRLRDFDRDRHTSPRRTAFIERNQRVFRVAVLVAALALVVSALHTPPTSLVLCASLGGLGLLHRRLKHAAALKSLYVSVAWTGICVGLPWLAAPNAPPNEAAAVTALLFPTFWANLVASNLRDDEAAIAPGRALTLARGALLLALAAAAFVPPSLAALAWVPAFELLALARFRPTEHYGHLAVDGALLAGGLATLAHVAIA